jgi:hypothetical protein
MSGHKLTRGQRTAKLAAAVAVIGAPALLQAHPYPKAANSGSTTHWFADWEVNTNTAPTDFFITPFTNNGTVSSVKSALQVSANQDRPTGIKITNATLSSAAAMSLFNSTFGTSPHTVQPVSYVFCDFESGDSNHPTLGNVTKVKEVVKWTNISSEAGRNYVGEFALTPLTSVGFNYTGTGGQDPTRRGSLFYTKTLYNDAGVNMANTDLYPGSPSFRNKSTGDWANGNIRTGLFVGPIGRMTAVQNVLNTSYNGLNKSVQNADRASSVKTPQYHKQIPWVTRFNNFGNSSLNNTVVAGKPFAFKPGVAAGSLTAAQTANQMLGRGDFSAMIQHYRMRGAYTVNLFEPGVVGYTKAQMQDDVRAGWYGGALNTSDPNGANSTSRSAIAHVNSIYGASDSKPATMTLNPVIDGTSLSSGIRSENSGTIWSGEYSVNMKKLDILASNLDTVNHMIRFGQVDAYNVFTLKNGSGQVYDDGNWNASNRSALIEAGMHRLLQFDLVSTKVWSKSNYSGSYQTKQVWLLNCNYLVFQNNAGRGDTGIPEPTTFGMLAAAGSMSLVCRRQRRNKTA